MRPAARWLSIKTELIHEAMNHLDQWDGDFVVELATPDVGWIDTVFDLGHDRKVEISMSDVYDPLTRLKDWMERIIKNGLTGSSVCDLDNERSYTVLTYESLSDSNPEPFGLLTIVDNDGENIQKAWGVIRESVLIKTLYNAIMATLSIIPEETDDNHDFCPIWFGINSLQNIDTWVETVECFRSPALEAYIAEGNHLKENVVE